MKIDRKALIVIAAGLALSTCAVQAQTPVPTTDIGVAPSKKPLQVLIQYRRKQRKARHNPLRTAAAATRIQESIRAGLDAHLQASANEPLIGL